MYHISHLHHESKSFCFNTKVFKTLFNQYVYFYLIIYQNEQYLQNKLSL